ncbi:YDG/SRA domain-containing protein [Hymenobacter psychrotolerans]|uniref:SAD/SRA domain-containing protein n=1 Tax=Hymenobacter psychrotolerans DSM 18569 TaxID=1121959 RepID=A0A1M6TIR0_9BACT|nr:YDG/SRA domain-containing protein [Hymenobacter psychrotolerans]SHK56814.1 SAD/SRA domain-containing protein [Hymenobacter psychrotolerans DSM 18569]
MPRIFGHIGTYRPGDTFANRLELSLCGLHRPRRAGVSGSQAEGADSIVLAGAYADDRFSEAEIIYTGSGGRDSQSGHQVTDQEMTGCNLALRRSQETGLPVRVFQRVEQNGTEVLRYEGLYRVVSHEYTRGAAGFQVFLFRLVPVV